MRTKQDKLKTFAADLDKIYNATIQIGAIGTGAGRSISNNDLLAIHEFTDYDGGIAAPRAPITKTILNQQNRQNLKIIMQKLISANFDPTSGKIDVEAVLNGIGSTLKNQIKETILIGVSPDISEEQKKRTPKRRAAVPLIDKGIMVDNIEYGVIL